jgi:starch synthase
MSAGDADPSSKLATRVLHAAAECFPLAKTGGLGDVIGALSLAQRRQGLDARVALPAYRGLAGRLQGTCEVTAFRVQGFTFSVLLGRLGGDAGLPVYLLACAELFDRGGDPYRDEQGREFDDNILRFGCFAEAVARLAGSAEAGFLPQLVHLHDWQAAAAAAWLKEPGGARPATVYTIHNLAYQGTFDQALFERLGLPRHWWSPQGLEAWGQGSFMKAGIQFADRITTVSPGYAREIRTAEYGCGLDGSLRAREAQLGGIVNGIDTAVWDPRIDPALYSNYGSDDAGPGKAVNKSALQEELGLDRSEAPLLVFIGRLAQQKGADLILDAHEELLKLPAQYVLLAAGEAGLEQRCRAFAAAAPAGRVQVRIAHDEHLAHRLTAAADLLLMPSRYEPCGLNQMYAQRYGTVPVVRATGGLADTVVDATAATLADGSASGVHFRDADAGGVLYGVRHALELIADADIRQRMRRAGMERDFSWQRSAAEYLGLYRSLLGEAGLTG